MRQILILSTAESLTALDTNNDWRQGTRNPAAPAISRVHLLGDLSSMQGLPAVCRLLHTLFLCVQSVCMHICVCACLRARVCEGGGSVCIICLYAFLCLCSVVCMHRVCLFVWCLCVQSICV